MGTKQMKELMKNKNSSFNQRSYLDEYAKSDCKDCITFILTKFE